MRKEGQTGTETQTEAYRQHIIDTLEGKIPHLRDIPKGRLGWGGISAFLTWYDGLSGRDRDSAIKAMGEIIGAGMQNPVIATQVVELATMFGLTQLELQVRKLQKSPAARIDFVKEAIDGFFVRLKLNHYIQERVEKGELP